jgi:hypothetical protein
VVRFWEIEPIGFADRLDAGYERESNSKSGDLNNGKDGIAILGDSGSQLRIRSGKCQMPKFRHVNFEMSTIHPSTDVK